MVNMQYAGCIAENYPIYGMGFSNLVTFVKS